MTILITGGAGFVGSHIALILLEKGFNLIILDSFINSKSLSINRVLNILKTNGFQRGHKINIKVIKGDISDQRLLSRLFEKQNLLKSPIEAVVHCAGLKSVRESIEQPSRYWDVNVNGSKNLFEVMENFKCRKIVFSSSAAVYGTSKKGIFSEESRLNPTNPYGQTKLAIEKLLEGYTKSKSSKWQVLNLRYFNPIGAHESGLLGEDPIKVDNNLFPIINRAAIGLEKKVLIYGNNWDTIDGTCVRDYIHIMDLAEAHVKGLNYLLSKKNSFTNINIGTGRGTTVLELIKLYKKVNNCNFFTEFANHRKGDVRKLIAEVNLARELLNWAPRRSLEQMCFDSWNWQKNIY